jgi:hypothetical protein
MTDCVQDNLAVTRSSNAPEGSLAETAVTCWLVMHRWHWHACLPFHQVVHCLQHTKAHSQKRAT